MLHLLSFTGPVLSVMRRLLALVVEKACYFAISSLMTANIWRISPAASREGAEVVLSRIGLRLRLLEGMIPPAMAMICPSKWPLRRWSIACSGPWLVVKDFLGWV